jgi:hypothetical protein
MTIYRSKREPGRRGRRGRLQRLWMRTVQAGDVLVSPSGSMRVVREVSFYGNGDLHSVTLAIRRCSWTGRPYTIYDYTMLRTLGWRPAGVRIDLDTELDCWLQADIGALGSPSTVTCCEAKDMA